MGFEGCGVCFSERGGELGGGVLEVVLECEASEFESALEEDCVSWTGFEKGEVRGKLPDEPEESFSSGVLLGFDFVDDERLDGF